MDAIILKIPSEGHENFLQVSALTRTEMIALYIKNSACDSSIEQGGKSSKSPEIPSKIAWIFVW